MLSNSKIKTFIQETDTFIQLWLLFFVDNIFICNFASSIRRNYHNEKRLIIGSQKDDGTYEFSTDDGKGDLWEKLCADPKSKIVTISYSTH